MDVVCVCACVCIATRSDVEYEIIWLICSLRVSDQMNEKKENRIIVLLYYALI